MARLPRVSEQLAEPLQPAKEQADGGRARAADLLRHVGHREPPQVVQLDDPPLILRQPGDGVGEPQQLLAADGPLARRRLVGH